MSHSPRPKGLFAIPLFIFGFVSLFLGLAIEALGLLAHPTLVLRESLEAGGFVFLSKMGMPDFGGIMITAFSCFGVVAAVLATPSRGCRLVLGFSSLIVTLGLFPTFAVWGVFWKPLGMAVAVCWAWFSSYIYAFFHEMPCEQKATSMERAFPDQESFNE